MRPVRRLLVRLLGAPAAGLAVAALQLTSRRRGLALLYHAVDERHGDPRREIVAPHGARLFERHLRHLRRHYRVVEPGELLAAAASRRRGGRFPVAITLDDDLPSHARLALPLLARFGLPATFFLSGASLEAPFSFWWQRLQRAYDGGGPARAAAIAAAGAHESAGIHELARAVEAMEPAERDTFAGRLAASSDTADAMPAADVESLVAGGATIGFHTLRHDSLEPLDDDGLDDALSTGRAPLEKLAGAPLRQIAYPHGAVDARVAEAARAAGFRWGFSAEGRAVRADDDPLRIPRIAPGHRSPGHFAAQLLWELLDR